MLVGHSAQRVPGALLNQDGRLTAPIRGRRAARRRAGSNKVAFDLRSGASYFRKGAVWHHLVRHIDRENDRYVETITVLGTGERVRHVDEPLSQHIGHGSDRRHG